MKSSSFLVAALTLMEFQPLAHAMDRILKKKKSASNKPTATPTANPSPKPTKKSKSKSKKQE